MTKYYFMIIQTDYLQPGRATVSRFLCLSAEQLVRYWNCIKLDGMGQPTPTSASPPTPSPTPTPSPSPRPRAAHHVAVTDWLLIA